MKKFEMVLMVHSGARGTLIYEKNLMSKISCQTPFKEGDVHAVTAEVGGGVDQDDSKRRVGQCWNLWRLGTEQE